MRFINIDKKNIWYPKKAEIINKLFIKFIDENPFIFGYTEVYRTDFLSCGTSAFFDFLKKKYENEFSVFLITGLQSDSINIELDLKNDKKINYENLMLSSELFNLIDGEEKIQIHLTIDYETIFLINSELQWVVFFNKYFDLGILFEKKT